MKTLPIRILALLVALAVTTRAERSLADDPQPAPVNRQQPAEANDSADAPTRANIEEAFTTWLPTATRPGDTIFVFYVGHGNQVHSLDRQRSDALESYLTVYDLDPGRVANEEAYDEFLRGRMILESTLARWLQELPGRQTVLLIEACRSGGFADTKGAAPKGTLAKGQVKPWTFFLREAGRVKGISQLGTLVICACAADESDRFTIGPDAISWMPHFLIQAMDKLPAPLTVRQAFDYYRRGVKQRLGEVRHVGEQEPIMADNLLLPLELVPAAN